MNLSPIGRSMWSLGIVSKTQKNQLSLSLHVGDVGENPMVKPTFLLKMKPNTNIMSLEDALTSLEEASLLQPPLKSIIHIASRCSKERNFSCALRLHSYIQKKGLEAHYKLGNYLVSMLVEVGSMDKAKIAFNQLSLKTESSWDSLIKGYVNCGQLRQALVLYQQMQEDSLSPTVRTFVVLLKACGQLKDFERGSQIHSQISDKGFLKSDAFVGSALVDMYAKCGLLKKAHEVFEELPHRDVVLWNTLIAGYAKHEFAEQALDCFRQMQLEGVTPSAITFTCSLKACGSIGAICDGEDIHAEIDRQGLLTKDPVLGSALVDMYARCGFLEKAQKLCGQLSVRNIGACNALIAGYIKHNRSEEALKCFERMLLQDVSPDAITFICALKACCNIRALAKGQELHIEIDKRGLLKRDPVVGSTLVDMYVKCGSLVKAREVFDELPIRTVVSWNSLLSGYVEHEHGAEALRCLEQMDSDGISPNVITYICGLKACGIIRAADKGQDIHSEIVRKGLMEEDIYVGSTLVDMYAKCGWLAKAQEVFAELPFRNVVVWNALIGGYTKQECDHEALVCFEQMQSEGVSPDAITFTCSLKACGSMGAIDKGWEIHAEIARKGLLDTDSLLGSSLVGMYAGCGLLLKAQEVFDKLPAQNLDAWNSLISGYVEHECIEEALHCFEKMLGAGVSPDTVTLICSLKACGGIRAANKGSEIHAEIERKGLIERDLVVGCALVDMYAKCGLLEKAHEVFGKLSAQNIGSWNALIAGHVNQEHGEEALNCFYLMQIKGVDPDAITYACTLKACGSIGALVKGIELHEQIIRDRSLETNFMIGNALVDMYAKCGLLTKAQEVFEKLLDKDVVSWNALIGGYVKHNKGEEALFCFEEMQDEGISPDAITFTSILKACGIIGAIDKAREIHAETERQGLLETDLAVANAVVDMYAKCCSFAKANEVFRELPCRDVIAWNALIGGYARHDYGQESLNCFEQMQIEGISPDATTFACSLRACSSIGAVNKGRKIHAKIEREGLLGKDDVVGNALVYMYAKCGFLAKAQVVFDNLPSKSSVSWNALIAAYTSHLYGEEALKCFEEMQCEGVSPNSITFLCSLKACGSIAAFDKGSDIHADVERQGLLDDVIGNAIVDMYAKCGALATAEEVFERFPSHDIFSWNALIGGYAQLGESEIVFRKVDRMIGEGIDPNEITYVSVLNACSHAGLVDEARIYFGAMIQVFGIIPIAEHHTCMVDLLGRAGQEESAMALIMEIPFHPDIIMWCAVLGACRKWSNVELGRQAFEHVVALDEMAAALYICMYNIYADADIQEHLELNA